MTHFSFRELSLPFLPEHAYAFAEHGKSRPAEMLRRHRRSRERVVRRNRSIMSTLSLGEDFEVKYCSKALGVSKDDLQRAVDKVGNAAAAVRKELGFRTA